MKPRIRNGIKMFVGVVLRGSTNGLSITLPAAAARELGWIAGDLLTITMLDDGVVINIDPDPAAKRIRTQAHLSHSSSDNRRVAELRREIEQLKARIDKNAEADAAAGGL